MILFPDLPVYKHGKKSIRDVSIYDGLYYAKIALVPPPFLAFGGPWTLILLRIIAIA
jgi:hypothetical protein